MNYDSEIKRLREEAGLSYGELAKICGIDRANIQKMEAGIRPITDRVFVRILAAFGYRLEKRLRKIKNKRSKT
jgi:transcriptional regulator with XRE-family HTH domain